MSRAFFKNSPIPHSKTPQVCGSGKGTLSDQADVSITCPKNALVAILTGNQETVSKAIQVEGNEELLTLMMENMNQFPLTGTIPFNIIEP